jgi:hypothetical protein
MASLPDYASRYSLIMTIGRFSQALKRGRKTTFIEDAINFWKPSNFILMAFHERKDIGTADNQ